MFRRVHLWFPVAFILTPGLAFGQTAIPVKPGAAAGMKVAPLNSSDVTAPVTTLKIPPERIGDLVPNGNDLTLVVNGPGHVDVNGTTCKAKGSPPSALCQRSIAKGASATLVPTPDDGYAFTGWAGACAGKDGRCALTPTGAVQVAATFAKVAPKQMVKVSVSIPEGSGTVTTAAFAEATINCTRKSDGTVAGQCDGSFPVGTTVGLDAKAAAGAGLKGWQGASGCEGYTCSFQVMGPVTLTAKFTNPPSAASETLTLVSNHNGAAAFRYNILPDSNVICQPSDAPANTKDWSQKCTAKFPAGTQVTLKASRVVLPDPKATGGYPEYIPLSADSWAGDCAQKNKTDCTILMDGPKTVIVQ